MEKKHEEEWRIYGKKADFDKIAADFSVTPYTARLIRNRNVCGEEEIKSYLYGDLTCLAPAESMKDLTKAVDLLLAMRREKKRVRIIGDYDADGVCSTALLFRTLKAAGISADWKVPDRLKDGYGLNSSFVEEAARDGIDLILTCDNGISAIEAVSLAKKRGILTIVTDHHELPEEEKDGTLTVKIPPADAVVCPKRPDSAYPYRELCGTGIAYRLAEVLLKEAGVSGQVIRGLMNDFLEYTAIATVADVCDLTGENRILVKEGLKRLQKGTRQPGLRALISCQNIKDGEISAYHIGYILGPTLNAAGRLASADLAVSLLLSENGEEAERIAQSMKKLNDERKEMTNQGVSRAEEIIREEHLDRDQILVIYLPDCHESLAGIIAGKIREEYYKPTIVLTNSKNGLKGSARSTEAYHMFKGLVGCSEYLEQYGGHPMAAGLSMAKENLADFRLAINGMCQLTEKDRKEKVWIDQILPFAYATKRQVEEMALLEPCGKGNEKPLFAERNVELLSLRLVGKDQNVAQMSLKDRGGTVVSAVYFEDCEELTEEIISCYGQQAFLGAMRGQSNPVRLHITYYPEINTFRGEEKIQIVVTHFEIPDKS